MLVFLVDKNTLFTQIIRTIEGLLTTRKVEQKMTELPAGNMPQPEMEQNNNDVVDAAIERGVNRVLDEVVDKALAQLSNATERESIRASLTSVVRETLSEVTEQEMMRQMSMAPMESVGAMAIGDAVNAGISAAKQVQNLGFVEFTAGLINGTFDAIIGATIKQMDAYAKLVADLAKTLAQFQAENVSDAQVNAHLAQRYPDGQGDTVVRANFVFPDTAADPNNGTSAKTGNQKFQEVVAALIQDTSNLPQASRLTRGSLGIDETDTNIKQFTAAHITTIRTAIALSLASTMMDHLRAMAREGMARIVITNGEILSKLTFNVDATDEQTTQKNQYQRSSVGAYVRGSAGWGWGRVSAGVSYSNLNVKTVNESSFDSVTMSAEIIGQVKIQFKTETFPPVVTQGNG